MAIDDLYERDFYVWTQEQAAALRAAGKAGGRSNAVDWDRVAEEVEDLGKSEYREAANYVTRILEHFFKLAWTQREEPKDSWRAEIDVFRLNVEECLTASLRAKVDADMERLHRIAAKQATVSFLKHEPEAARDETLRWTLDDVLGDAP
ncbi:MAG: DUF29 domain-containing protein [Hyphomonadaceae bacterium]|nr:DUF29 domain-containing protein [Hyphomonadaceae bacterium]